LDFGYVGGLASSMGAVFRFGLHGILELVEGGLDIAWHGDVHVALHIVPPDGETTTIKFTFPLLHARRQALGLGAWRFLHGRLCSEIINNKGESDTADVCGVGK
jgi:hypothetical protein